MYFSGIDIKVFIYYPPPITPLDIVDIQFNINQTASPLYTPSATPGGEEDFTHEYSTAMRGTSLVQGTLVLNLNNDTSIDFMNNAFDLLINMVNSGYERDTDPSSFYNYEEHKKGYILEGIQVISKNHTIHPSADNTVEVLHFIATSLSEVN